MSSYVISCCSTADLTEEHFSKREISYICFHYKLNDTEYADDLGKSMPFDQFYAAMAAGASTKTSQVNADEFEAYFETFLQDGKDILHGPHLLRARRPHLQSLRRNRRTPRHLPAAQHGQRRPSDSAV